MQLVEFGNNIYESKEKYDFRNKAYITEINKCANLVLSVKNRDGKTYHNLLNKYFELCRKYRKFKVEYEAFNKMFIEENNNIKLKLK